MPSLAEKGLVIPRGLEVPVIPFRYADVGSFAMYDVKLTWLNAEVATFDTYSPSLILREQDKEQVIPLGSEQANDLIAADFPMSSYPSRDVYYYWKASIPQNTKIIRDSDSPTDTIQYEGNTTVSFINTRLRTFRDERAASHIEIWGLAPDGQYGVKQRIAIGEIQAKFLELLEKRYVLYSLPKLAMDPAAAYWWQPDRQEGAIQEAA